MPPITVTAKDHGGGGKTRIEMWDGTKWVVQSQWSADYTDLVWNTVKQHSAEFAKSGGK
jgi:branched-chain amino acid transport system substrate-binding protein